MFFGLTKYHDKLLHALKKPFFIVASTGGYEFLLLYMVFFPSLSNNNVYTLQNIIIYSFIIIITLQNRALNNIFKQSFLKDNLENIL